MKKLLATLTLSLLAYTSYANQTTLEKNLKQLYPEIPAKVTGTTPIKGMYEIQVGDSFVYTDENARYFFVGNLVDFKNKENLTAKREQERNKIDISKLPLEQAIKNIKGDGSRILYVFSDPDCPYCQKLEQALTTVDNVTIYTFLYPLKNLHPNAELVASQIWCSNNRYEAWEDYMVNRTPSTTSPNCDNPIQKNIQLGRSLNISGTPTLFLKDGQRVMGGRDANEIEELLQSIQTK